MDIWEKVLIVLYCFLVSMKKENRNDGTHNHFFVFCFRCVSIRLHVISFSDVVFRMTSQTKTGNRNETGMTEQKQKRNKKIIFQFYPFLWYALSFCWLLLFVCTHNLYVFYVFGIIIIIICEGIRNIVDWFADLLLLCTITLKCTLKMEYDCIW